jgi:hypothetical protein
VRVCMLEASIRKGFNSIPPNVHDREAPNVMVSEEPLTTTPCVRE